MNHIPEQVQRGVGELAIMFAESVRVAMQLPWVIAPWLAGSFEVEANNMTVNKNHIAAFLTFDKLTAENFDQYVDDMQQRMRVLKGYFDNQTEDIQHLVYREVNEIFFIVGGLLSTLRSVQSDEPVQTNQVLPFDASESLQEQLKKLSGHFEKLDSYRMNTDILLGIDFQSDLGELETEVKQIIAAL